MHCEHVSQCRQLLRHRCFVPGRSRAVLKLRGICQTAKAPAARGNAAFLLRPFKKAIHEQRSTYPTRVAVTAQQGPKGGQILIDVPVQAYCAQFVEVLSKTTALNSLTHVIITHLAPNRVASLELLLKKAVEGRTGPQLEVVLSNPAYQLAQSKFAESATGASLLQSVQFTVARNGEEVLMAGRDPLQVVLVPTPRWPDLLCVYDSQSKLLFSSKLFSAHVSQAAIGRQPSAFDDGGWAAYEQDWRYFFDCMFAPMAKQVAGALEKLDIVEPGSPIGTSKLAGMFQSLFRALQGSQAPSNEGPHRMEVRLLAPLHGPTVRSGRSMLVREYRNWLQEQARIADSAAVAVMYASAYGNTTALAQAVSRGITKSGVAVNMINLELSTLDEVTEAIQQAQGFTLGCPTLGGHMPTPVQTAMGAILRDSGAKDLPCGVFGSFGWSGEAVDEMESRLKNAGFGFAFQPIRVKFKPTAKDLQVCEESGRDLAVAVKKRQKSRERNNASAVREAMASGSQLAMGRVVGSLGVLTAVDEDASSCMLASWISQASFDPPGLTIAIKRDRAMESLLNAGNKFSISLLAEGRDRLVMKQLTRPFAPGQDRLQGIEVETSKVTSAPIVKAANSYLDCQVVERMDAGDHWLVYATVLAGKVLDELAPTAVLHRKVGNHY